MNEQTRIELLKMATELSIAILNKHPNTTGYNSTSSKQMLDIFNSSFDAIKKNYESIADRDTK
jgi:hypothetical protein